LSDQTDNIIKRADTLVTASRTLDYQKIISHDEKEVQKLINILKVLDLDNASSASIEISPSTVKQGIDVVATSSGDLEDDKASGDVEIVADEKITSEGGAVLEEQRGWDKQEEDQKQRQQEVVAQLSDEGFAKRLGNVYDSMSDARSVPFSEVKHARGLPVFDMVLAPDFSPVSGLHGIFISPLEVFTAVLADPGDHEWKILKRRAYSSNEEMAKFVTLLSAGFELD